MKTRSKIILWILSMALPVGFYILLLIHTPMLQDIGSFFFITILILVAICAIAMLNDELIESLEDD